MSNCKHWNISQRGMVFDPETGDSFKLNESAQFILRLVREGSSVEEISKKLAEHFGISKEEALTDVLEFMVQLESMDSAA